MSRRRVLLVVHTGRAETCAAAREAAAALHAAGVEVSVLQPEAAQLAVPGAEPVPVDDAAARGAELVLVLGGDGTLLRAAELARPAGAPLLGINLGHVGFLAEIEPDRLESTVDHVLRGDYAVEERTTVDVTVTHGSQPEWCGWALNEVTVEKAERERMIDLLAEVDGRPLSRWGCDGLVVATPTGSTAYAFSAGGPVVAPEVDALVLVPISAHALFARPLVLGPRSTVTVRLAASTGGAAVFCDGRRIHELPPEGVVEVRRGITPVRLARIHPTPFSERLVAKFHLPVEGWRGR